MIKQIKKSEFKKYSRVHIKPKVIFIERKTEHFEKPNNQNTKNKTKSHFPASPTSNLPFFTI